MEGDPRVTDRELPCEPGWYRITENGWERVADVTATIADVAERYARCDLMLVETTDDVQQVSMW